jgi:endonuclease-3
LKPKQRTKLFERLRDAIPAPSSELKYNSHYELLVAVVLSAQATDISVNRATKTLFPQANTPEAMIALGVKRLKGHIKAIGLYNSKAKHIIKLSELLIERHQSKVPASRKELEALPGVGRKTANVILNTAFGKPTIAVDTHLFRVSNRTGLAPGKDVREVEDQLMKRVPDEFKMGAHHWLILHGRYTCTARKPRCRSCIIQELCQFQEKQINPNQGE